ncbi:trypsin Inhibitor like cysteine rich domain protein [Ancylostoma duodenale]|uniref:Trypsin Inhibitor like cysteine rich domain protein n=1 Tax=Ancylostoma duodenale TaxID=51022 RepID=A0A0C2CEH6_9BILA|nr:trypsin Inhibitor like cysteine rich domain protein [Ancylostoma duodenale]
MRCPPGSHCEMVAQPCHRQPCPPPSPQCINNGQHSTAPPPRPTTPPPGGEAPLPPPNCDNIQCPPGFLCQVISIPCQKPPCPPPTAQCFREQENPPVVCPINESWRNCSSKCEPTCDNKNPRCSKECGEPKCQCDRGLVRNRSGKCVRPSDCPRRHGRK